MRRASGFVAAAMVAAGVAVWAQESARVTTSAAGACERLGSLTLPDTTITLAQTVAAGAFQPPAAGRGAVAGGAVDPYRTLPAFCRVAGSVKRAGDSDVAFEVWMPIQGWNGEFRPTASGFAGGAMTYPGMADLLRQGWATANTNRGHDDGGGPWKFTDMTGVPIHLMVAQAKAVLAAYYQRAPQLTIMNECGGGGSRDALQLVQQFPADLDAAAAIGFVYDSTHHGIGQMWVYQATHKDAASYVPPGKYPLIHRAALEACDAKDGLRDGVIEDPPRCTFDPAVLACTGADGPGCLTMPQVAAVKQIYRPAVHARTGKYLFAGMVPGGELEWEPMAGPAPYNYTTGFYRNAVFKDQSWDITKGIPNFDTHVDLAEAPQNKAIDATNPDVRPFIARGGKLLLVGGWNDHTLAPGSFVDYYDAVVKAVGRDRARDAVRLFMVPGMDHCPAYLNFKPVHELDAVGILRRWKATGKAPDTISVGVLADDGTVARRRLVCAYPQVATYKGRGATADPANFSCKNP